MIVSLLIETETEVEDVKAYVDFNIDINSISGFYQYSDHTILIIGGNEYCCLLKENEVTRINHNLKKRSDSINFN